MKNREPVQLKEEQGTVNQKESAICDQETTLKDKATAIKDQEQTQYPDSQSSTLDPDSALDKQPVPLHVFTPNNQDLTLMLT